MKHHRSKGLRGLLAATTLGLAAAADLPIVPSLPTPAKPDGKEEDMSKPVQVFILMGQSNMVGMGETGGEGEGSLKHASNPLSMGGSGNGHYEGNPQTYMNVGEAMGKAMLGLMKNQAK